MMRFLIGLALMGPGVLGYVGRVVPEEAAIVVLAIGFMIVIGFQGTMCLAKIAFTITIGLVIGIFREVFRDFTL